MSDILSDNDGGEWVRVQQGKGRKDRLVPLSLDVVGVLRDYLAGCKRRSGDYLFPTMIGRFI